ncbi:SDR family NAD(P)-dependent oxidoreductase [Streptomyces sp. NPDC091268]|uniref:SDR family NAD(P)-dependent oxidoreductase n=1 Tax=Streptomyces sp. NPDC091268 TaxID=3365979 RepID=UPI0038061EBF
MEGRVVVVTGGAGGIGAAVCRGLAAGNASVAAVDLDAGGLDSLVRDAKGTGGGSVTAYVTDVTAGGVAEAVLGQVESELGPVGALVNVAGVLRRGPAALCSLEDWSALFAVNATAVFLWSAAAARRMAGRPGASIVTVASNAVGVPRVGMAAYAASKAAAAAFTLGLGLEAAAHGVRCNVVCPGSTDTPMLAAMGPNAAAGAVAGDAAAFRAGIPLGRLAAPQDVADAVVFLLSEQARHITMHSLYVDGGAALRG